MTLLRRIGSARAAVGTVARLTAVGASVALVPAVGTVLTGADPLPVRS